MIYQRPAWRGERPREREKESSLSRHFCSLRERKSEVCREGGEIAIDNISVRPIGLEEIREKERDLDTSLFWRQLPLDVLTYQRKRERTRARERERDLALRVKDNTCRECGGRTALANTGERDTDSALEKRKRERERKEKRHDVETKGQLYSYQVALSRLRTRPGKEREAETRREEREREDLFPERLDLFRILMKRGQYFNSDARVKGENKCCCEDSGALSTP